MRCLLTYALIFTTLCSCYRKDYWENRYDKDRKLQKAFKSKEAVDTLYGEQIRIWDVGPGEIVADIGAYDGVVAGLISIFSDSATIYVQDADTSNFHIFPRIRNHMEDLRGNKFSNSFVMVPADYDSTYLPKNTFNKVILNNVLRYVDDKPTFLKEIHSILKKDGLFYVRTILARTEEEAAFIPTEKDIINAVVSEKFLLISEHEVLSGMYTIFVFKKSDRDGRKRN